MLNSEQNLAAKNPTLLAEARSQQYHQIITELSIEQSTSIPVFTDATAQVIRLSDSPVAILSAISESGCQIGSISGLEQFDRLPANSNLLLELAGIDYCHRQVMTCERSFRVTNFDQHPQLANSALGKIHGIGAYLGVPITTASGDRLGAISILDFKPRHFSDRDVDLLQLVSRWVASEFERKFLSQAQLNRWIGDLRHQGIRGFDDHIAAVEHECELEPLPRQPEPISTPPDITFINNPPNQDLHLVYPHIKGEIQFKLLTHLAQALRTPLTAVLGMASVLQQEVYGPLSGKQKDYVGIIHCSGQQLVTIVDEIIQLGVFDQQQHQLNLNPVDLEMLCQLAIKNLEPVAQQKHQRIVLKQIGGERQWLLDKDKVKQIIYYLSLSLIQATASHHQIEIQLSNLTERLQIQITSSDSQAILPDFPAIAGTKSRGKRAALTATATNSIAAEIGVDIRIQLGLSLSQTLAALHGGKIEFTTTDCGYQLSLPVILTNTHAERLRHRG